MTQMLRRSNRSHRPGSSAPERLAGRGRIHHNGLPPPGKVIRPGPVFEPRSADLAALREYLEPTCTVPVTALVKARFLTRAQKRVRYTGSPSHARREDRLPDFQQQAIGLQRQLREKYAAESGTIIDEFYCRGGRGGAVLTRPDEKLRKEHPELGVRELRTALNTDEPKLMELLYDCERMSGDVAHVFDRNRQETEIDDLIGSIFGAVSSVLLAANPLPKKRKAVHHVQNRLAQPIFEVGAVAKRVDIAVQRQARFTYLGGVLAGAILAVGMFALLALAVDSWGSRWVDVSAFTAATSFGVLGAMASVFQRVSTGSLVIDYTAPLAQRLLLGGLRPFVGGLFGLIVQFILVSGPLASQSTGTEASTFAFFAVAGFLSGFSERFAVDMIERAGQGLAEMRQTKANGVSEELLGQGRASSAGSGR